MGKSTECAVDLQLFAEGAGSAASGVSASGNSDASAVTAPNAGVKKKGSNPLSEVRYGLEDEPEQVAAAEAESDEKGAKSDSANPDRKAEFRRLISEEYKDLYDEGVQKIVRGRVKGMQETVAKYEALAPTLEMLGKKYGVDASNAEALRAAILNDDSYYEAEAMERGMPVSQLKEIRRMEMDNAALRREKQEREARDNAARIYDGWRRQAAAAKAVYPSLDLKTELSDPRFADLLRNNIDVKTAYEVIHKDEIIPAAMQFAAKTATEKVAAGIASGASRPAENGTNPQSAAAVKLDVSKMTKAERAEIARRVARGEKIRL